MGWQRIFLVLGMMARGARQLMLIRPWGGELQQLA